MNTRLKYTTKDGKTYKVHKTDRAYFIKIGNKKRYLNIEQIKNNNLKSLIGGVSLQQPIQIVSSTKMVGCNFEKFIDESNDSFLYTGDDRQVFKDEQTEKYNFIINSIFWIENFHNWNNYNNTKISLPDELIFTTRYSNSGSATIKAIKQYDGNYNLYYDGDYIIQIKKAKTFYDIIKNVQPKISHTRLQQVQSFATRHHKN